MPNVGLISLGCPKNLVDSEIMLGLLEKAGYRIVHDPARADILIVNTCSFIEDAKRESIDTIFEMGQYKKSRCKKLVVAGCLPQRYEDELAKLLPEVDLFVGTGEYHKIVELLDKPSNHRTIEPSHGPFYIHNVATPRKIATARHAVYIKIAEGCFHGCSFCIIPKLRGKFRSRSMDDIVAEAKNLLAAGARELNLIAQDTTSYGHDLKDGSTLAKLLRRLSELDGDFWIRIMYAYPTSFTDELIDVVARSKKICKYFDVPIQHINDRILKVMRRKETGADIRRLIEKLRAKIPSVSLRTSLIVGFPGETDAEFNELLDFVKEGHFNYMGAFPYSREDGTPAARLKCQISKEKKESRFNRIMAAQAKVSKRFNQQLIGRKIKVLVETISLSINPAISPSHPATTPSAGRHLAISRSAGQAPGIDGVVSIKPIGSNMLKVGEFTNVKITGVGKYDLEGKPC